MVAFFLEDRVYRYTFNSREMYLPYLVRNVFALMFYCVYHGLITRDKF
jgi:hypothetical protein